jgi:endonuclease-3
MPATQKNVVLPRELPQHVVLAGIWRKRPSSRAHHVRTVCEILQRHYGVPRFGNPGDPLDDLVYIIVSNKTSPETAKRTYSHLKRRFHTWGDVLGSRPRVLKSILKPAGLSTVRSQQVRAALKKIKKDFGICDLRQLRGKPQSKVHDYLVSLPGVSDKVAKCIMMYTLAARVLPVDVHVHRVARRLGWTTRKRADQCHQELEALVPPNRRYAYHVDCIAHGRSVCRPRRPLCEQCCINRYCEYFKRERTRND